MDKVSQKILEDAKKERNKIIKEAEKKKKDIGNRVKAEIDRLTEDTQKKVRETKEKELDRLIGLKEIEHRNTLLEHKRNLLKSLFDEIIEDILESNNYSKLMESLFITMVESGDEEVLVGKGEKVVDKKFIQKINKKNDWKLKLSEEKLSIKGGFFLRGKNKDFDASIETLVREKWEVLEPKLVALLFAK